MIPCPQRVLRGVLATLMPITWTLAEGPSPIEQYAIELINRARNDPAAEAARFGIDLNDGSMEVTLSPDPRPPLAIDLLLQDAAHKHLCWMISPVGGFTHTESGREGEHCFTGVNPWDRVIAAGYTWAEMAENLSITGIESELESADDLHRNLFVDDLIPSRPHRIHLLNGALQDIGMAYGDTTALVLKRGEVQVLGNSQTADKASLTGVVFDDADGSAFYTPGEGLGGVEIEILASDLKGTTWDAGGYTVDITTLADGEHTVRFRQAERQFEANFTKAGAVNVKVDALWSAFTEAPPEPAGWAALNLDPRDDADRDGLPALVEYALRTDRKLSTPAIWWDARDGVLVVPGPGGDDWPDDVHIAIESSATLAPDSWEIVSARTPDGEWQPEGIVSPDGPTRVRPPADATVATYYRVRVSLP